VTTGGQQRTFDDLGVPLHRVTFCVLDLETTGTSPADCEITEVGALRFSGGELTGTFQTLVNPGKPIPPMITVLTGITHAMVVEAPRIGEVLPSLLEFVGDAVIVGHNVRFDVSFLDAAAIRLGYGKLPNLSVDTLGLARRLVRDEVRHLDLATLAAHLRSPISPAHRALDDAQATAHVFWELLARAGTIGATHLEDLLRLSTAKGAPHYAKIGLTERLPRTPGVYLFRDGDRQVIYVGKARNLRTRVRSYFYGDTRRAGEHMLRDLADIDYRECATELEALVTELRLIHAHRPRYNRRSRPAKATHWVKLTEERFPRLSVVRTLGSESLVTLGPYRSRPAAVRVVEAIWDAVPIRRCRTRGGSRSTACTFARFGVSLCPCDGTVSDATYQAVVTRLLDGVQHDPALLLDPLVDKIRAHARDRRFEEAALVRDRHRALSRSLEQRRVWQTLQRAGALWAEDGAGESTLIEDGKLLAAWVAPAAPPLMRIAPSDASVREVPSTTAEAEECQLVWDWLNRPEVRIIEAARPFDMPSRPVRRLESLAK